MLQKVLAIESTSYSQNKSKLYFLNKFSDREIATIFKGVLRIVAATQYLCWELVQLYAILQFKDWCMWKKWDTKDKSIIQCHIQTFWVGSFRRKKELLYGMKHTQHAKARWFRECTPLPPRKIFENRFGNILITDNQIWMTYSKSI